MVPTSRSCSSSPFRPCRSVARVPAHRQSGSRFRRQLANRIEAYKKDPPPPPGIAGPLILLALLGVGGSAPKPGRSRLATLAPPRADVPCPRCGSPNPKRSGRAAGSLRNPVRGVTNGRNKVHEANAQPPKRLPPKPTQTRSRTHLAKTGPLEADLLSPLDGTLGAGQVRWDY